MAKLSLFHFDAAAQGCKIAGQPFVVPLDPPCRHREIHITATPKANPPCAVDNCDAQHHGRDLTWWASGPAPLGEVIIPDDEEVQLGNCAVVGGMETEPTFNRFVRAIGTRCQFQFRARLIAPDGKVFTVEKTVTVQ